MPPVHHGLGSIDYQLNRHGTKMPGPLGDTTVTCITCHGPHEKGAGSNIRVPKMLSFNSRFTGGATNRMMDGTAIPPNAGKGIICLFCHQGRESGVHGIQIHSDQRGRRSVCDSYCGAQCRFVIPEFTLPCRRSAPVEQKRMGVFL